MTGDQREAIVHYWTDLGLSTRAARLLTNDGCHDLISLQSGKWFLIPRCGEKMWIEVFKLLERTENER